MKIQRSQTDFERYKKLERDAPETSTIIIYLLFLIPCFRVFRKLSSGVSVPIHRTSIFWYDLTSTRIYYSVRNNDMVRPFYRPSLPPGHWITLAHWRFNSMKPLNVRAEALVIAPRPCRGFYTCLGRRGKKLTRTIIY